MDTVPADPVRTFEQLCEAMRDAAPPTDDDCTILWDGTRIDSKEKALAWLAELDQVRAAEARREPGHS